MEIYPLEIVYPSEVKSWSITRPAECLVTHAKQTGSDYFARIRLSVDPYKGPENIVFINAVSYQNYSESQTYPDPPERFNDYVSRVKRGIEIVLGEKAESGTPIACLLITLTLIETNPVDSKGKAFERAAVLCLNRCFAEGELICID